MYREFSSLSGLSEAPSLRSSLEFVYSHITAADEKIPLSVVDVNKKPQYLVFSLHFGYPVSKQRQLVVESCGSSGGTRGRASQSASNPVQAAGIG
jgi:hypothetical protein